MHGSILTTASPWHAGEIALQRRVGVAERMDVVGRRILRDHLIDQHREFYPQLPFIVAGAVDPSGNAWGTVLAGRPGFLTSPDPSTLHVAASPNPADPAASGMRDGDAIGLVGIELHTRRRNRLNGTIRRSEEASFDVAVGQSYGNCPQYIQLRDFGFSRDPAVPVVETAQRLSSLDGVAEAMIAKADTFFIASYADREDSGRQIDVSHRGGRPGFVRIGADGVLTIPDFAGNLFFNTLGNILINPRSGLVFIDFETGDLLQLSGEGEVVLDAPEIAAFQGAERLLRFTPTQIVFRPGAVPLRWLARPQGASPNALLTGSWQEASARLQAAGLGATWRPFRVAGIVEESAVIRSLYLEPADGAGLIAHQAGQHLPIRVKLPERDEPVIRTYTLSSAPSDGVYRISVKREGAVSRFLHGLQPGDMIEARVPAGDFTIDALAERPAVLLGAGIGITPMLSMLRHIVYEGLRKRRIRPTWLLQAARSKSERAFDREIAALTSAAEGAVQVLRVLSDSSGADEADYDRYGRIDLALLRSILPFGDYDFYLCGPGPFMQDLYDGLRGLDVPDARIHAEAFGPSSFRRRRDAGPSGRTLQEPAQAPVPVNFAASGRQAVWHPKSGSLLELAEAQGLNPPFSCRAGSCGSCRTRVLAGAVSYQTEPTAEIGEDEALICCSVPAAGGELELDL
jgi:ferredoxin-NADP reductase/predicted pyridoxine 5'-phosphate oxidase superfamily flavin-nucleotide-binding protein